MIAAGLETDVSRALQIGTFIHFSLFYSTNILLQGNYDDECGKQQPMMTTTR